MKTLEKFLAYRSHIPYHLNAFPLAVMSRSNCFVVNKFSDTLLMQQMKYWQTELLRAIAKRQLKFTQSATHASAQGED